MQAPLVTDAPGSNCQRGYGFQGWFCEKVPVNSAVPAFEDPLYWVWESRDADSEDRNFGYASCATCASVMCVRQVVARLVMDAGNHGKLERHRSIHAASQHTFGYPRLMKLIPKHG
jgi:hypothetical protein